MSDRFVPLQSLSQAEALAAKTKVFTGDGGYFLRVPGLLKLASLRVGSTEVPLSETRLHLTSSDETQPRKAVEEPLVMLDADAEGAVLRRSILSNDGRWQKGVSIFVAGDWEEDNTSSVKSDSPSTVSAGTSDNVPGVDSGSSPNPPSGNQASGDQVVPGDQSPPDAGASFVDTTAAFADLDEAVKAALRQFPTLDALANATNEEFNRAGITGLVITQVRARVNRAKTPPTS